MSERKIRPQHRKIFYFFQTIVRWASYLNHRRENLVKNLFPTQWETSGYCLACGACCDYPTIEVPEFYFKHKRLLDLLIKWHCYWYGLLFYSLRPGHRQIVFTCPHLTAERTCDDYSHRPQMCRDYPEIRTWFAKPDFFEGCGFKPVRKTDRLVQEQIETWKKRNQSLLNSQKEIDELPEDQPE